MNRTKGIQARGNRFWFELARVRVIGSRLYFSWSSLNSGSWTISKNKWYLDWKTSSHVLKNTLSRSGITSLTRPSNLDTIYLYLKKFRNFMSERPRQPPKHKSPRCISTEVDIYFHSCTKCTLITVNRQKLWNTTVNNWKKLIVNKPIENLS